MIVNIGGRGILVFLPMMLCLSTLTYADAPQNGAAAPESAIKKPAAGAQNPASTAGASPTSGAKAGGAGPASGSEENDEPATRSLVDPTQPWPRSEPANQ